MTTGTTITATATVLFNNAPPQDTAPLVYTFDTVAPTTATTVTQLGSSANYQVTWSSTDDPGGSGVAYVTLYVAEDGGAYQIWQDQLAEASGTMIYQGQAGHTYTFLALATDVAGNHEQPPAVANVPQDTTTVNLGALPTVPSTTPPNFGIPPAPIVQPSTNPLFTQAQQGVPGRAAGEQPVRVPDGAPAVPGPVVRHRLRPERRHPRPDGDRRRRPTAASSSAAARRATSCSSSRRTAARPARRWPPCPTRSTRWPSTTMATSGRPPAAARCSSSTRPPARSSTSSARASRWPWRSTPGPTRSTSRPARASRSSTRRTTPSPSTAATRTCASPAWRSITKRQPLGGHLARREPGRRVRRQRPRPGQADLRLGHPVDRLRPAGHGAGQPAVRLARRRPEHPAAAPSPRRPPS